MRLLLAALAVFLLLPQGHTQSGGTNGNGATNGADTRGGPLATAATSIAGAVGTGVNAITTGAATVVNGVTNGVTTAVTNSVAAGTTPPPRGSSSSSASSSSSSGYSYASTGSSSSGKLFSSSVSTGSARTNGAHTNSNTHISATSSSSSFSFGSTGGNGRYSLSSSGTPSPLFTSSSSSSDIDFSVVNSGAVAGSGYIPPPSVFPVIAYATAYWELNLGFSSSCLGYRNRTIMLNAISPVLYEAAYTGCRYRDSSASVLSVRANLTSSGDQKKELSSARSKLKGTNGLTSESLVSLDVSSSHEKDLSAGAIAGIVIGVVLFVAVVAGVAIYVYMHQAAQDEDPSDYTRMKDESKKGSAAVPKR